MASSPLMDESVEGNTIWLDGIGSAPSAKFLRVDYDPDDEQFRSFSSALAVLSEFAPSFIIPGHVGRIVHDLKNARVFLRLEPRHADSVSAANDC
jgi:hypothetical protein